MDGPKHYNRRRGRLWSFLRKTERILCIYGILTELLSSVLLGGFSLNRDNDFVFTFNRVVGHYLF